MAGGGRLTKSVIDRAQYAASGPKGHCILWDAEVPGFGLRIYPSGAKAFLVAYRIGTRKRRVILGRYGLLTLDQARQMARKSLVAAKEGRDLAEEREKALMGETVADLCRRYLDDHLPKKKASSRRHDRRMIRDRLLPPLGKLKVADVKRADIAKIHSSLAATPYEANRVLALCSKVFNLAEEWGLRPDHSNPTRHITKFKEQRRQRFLSGEELARLGVALAEAAAEGSESDSAILALRLLALTGARLSEVLTLAWSSVDAENGLLHLPDSKTGPKVIPIGPAVLQVLSVAPRLAGNPYVCYGDREGRPFVGLPRVWQRIRRRAGLENVRLHDLRHSHAAAAAGLGTSLQIIGALLGHAGPQTTARYAHLGDDPVRTAANRVSNHIAAAMSGQPAAEVIPFKKA